MEADKAGDATAHQGNEQVAAGNAFEKGFPGMKAQLVPVLIGELLDRWNISSNGRTDDQVLAVRA
jgi:hypothetical protein